MNIFYKSEMRWFISILLLGLVDISCQKNEESVEQFLDNLPHEHPEEINRFQQAESVYFDYLGYTTIPRKDGSVVLYDRGIPLLFQVNEQGNLKKILSLQGRGPGEVLDIISITGNGKEGILLYDQDNNKVVEYNQQLEYETEFLPEPYEGNNITDVYPAPDNENYMLLHSSYAYLKDKTQKPQKFFTRYNADSNTYEHAVTLQDRQFARLVRDGAVRGGRSVSFSPRQLIVNNPQGQSIYTFWTGSNVVAEMSSSLDTVNTIPIDLPTQAVNQQERDSLRDENSSEQWKTLGDLLPEVKIPVEKMKIDAQNRFWLQLNYRGYTQKWLIMSQEGEPQKIVHLPRGSMLTHISDHHLGVRLDEITFGLYEPVD